MRSLKKPKAWNIKGHLTQAPDLWREVKFLCPVWSDIPTDISPYRHVASSTTQVPSALSEKGKSLEATADNQYWKFTDKGFFESNDQEVVMFGVATWTGDSAFRELFSLGDNVFTKIIQKRSSDELAMRVDVVAGSFFYPIVTHTMSPGDVFAYVGRASTIKQRVSFTVRRLSDGETWTETWTGTPAVTTSSVLQSNGGNLFLCNLTDSFSRAWKVPVYMAGLSGTFWSDSETEFFLSDPFAMLRPAGF